MAGLSQLCASIRTRYTAVGVHDLCYHSACAAGPCLLMGGGFGVAPSSSACKSRCLPTTCACTAVLQADRAWRLHHAPATAVAYIQQWPVIPGGRLCTPHVNVQHAAQASPLHALFVQQQSPPTRNARSSARPMCIWMGGRWVHECVWLSCWSLPPAPLRSSRYGKPIQGVNQQCWGLPILQGMAAACVFGSLAKHGFSL